MKGEAAEAAVQYLQEKVSPGIIHLSGEELDRQMDKFYPTGAEGFVADFVAGSMS